MRPSRVAAAAIAARVSLDFDLHPRLSGRQVQLMLDPMRSDIGRRELESIYGLELAAGIESRIRQEVDFV